MHSGNTRTPSGSASNSDRTVVERSNMQVSGTDQRPSLVIQTAFLGDVILAIPLLKRVRQLRPGAPLWIVVRRGLGNFLQQLGLVDGFFEIEKNQGQTYSALSTRLQSVEFKWIICPHESFRSAWLCFGLRAESKIAFEKWWNFFAFSNRTLKPLDLPDPLRQMSLLRLVDLETEQRLKDPGLLHLNQVLKEGQLPQVPFWAELSLRDEILRWPDPFALSQPYVCVFPGSVWNTKRWSQQGFAEVGCELTRRGFQVIWMGGQEENRLCAELESACPESRSLAGKTSIPQSLAVLARASLALSNDSGGQHMASLAGVPIVSLFGPTVLSQGFRPWSSAGVVIENPHLKCRPCGRHGHKKCPIGTHECMKSILPQHVVPILLKHLN